MSDEIIDDYVITDDWGEDNALIFPDGGTGSGGNTPAPVVPLATFGPDIARIAGTICWAQWGEVGGAFSCNNGELTVPLPPKATYTSGTTITTSSPGLISGVEFSKTDTTSEIDDGQIKLAAANASAHCDGTTDGTPGGIYGIGYNSTDTFEISKGYVRIPRPPAQGYFPSGIYDAVHAQKVNWSDMGAGVFPLTSPSNPKDGDIRIAAILVGGYLSLLLQKYKDGGWA